MSLAQQERRPGFRPVPRCQPETVLPLPTAERGEIRVRLRLRHAGARDVRIAYELVGPAEAPAVWVAGGISADRHVLASDAFVEHGWWQGQAGKGLNPRTHRLLSIDWLGADAALDVPIDSADQADAIAGVLAHLGIGSLDAFIGASYGAMVGLQFAARHPARLQRLLAISGAHRAHPYASAWRAMQRQVVLLGQSQCDEGDGLALARQLAMLGYRTPEEFEARFDAPARVVGGRVRVAAEDYLQDRGIAWSARTSATAFQRLSESIDLHRVTPERISTPTTLLAVAEDRVVPLCDMHALHRRVPLSTLVTLSSLRGHDAFLTETDALAQVIHTVLAQAGAR